MSQNNRSVRYDRNTKRTKSSNVNKNINYNHTSHALDYNKNINNLKYAPKSNYVYGDITGLNIENAIIKRREEEIRRKARVKKAKIENIKRREAFKRERINHLICYFLAFYLICIGVFVLSQFDNNNLIESEILAKQEIVNNQEKQISDAKVELANSIDMNEIEDIARNELNMGLPSKDQIVYITLPKNRSYIDYEQQSK